MNPDISLMAFVVVAAAFFLAGMTVPTYYGVERLRGTGRWLADRLPYKPPPGETEESQLEEMDGEGDTNE